MKAIILTAGFGRRMRPLTDNCHKTMLPIAGKTIISSLVESLVDNNVFQIVVVLGYRAVELKEYLDDKYCDTVEFQYVMNERYRETNNIFSLALAFEEIEIDQDLLVIESDLIVERQIIKFAVDSEAKNVALVDHYKPGMDGTVVKLSDNIITEVIPPHLQDKNFNFSDKFKTLNIYKFSKEFSANKFKKLLTYYAKVIDDNCYYELILGILIYMQGETINALNVDGYKWAEVDDPNDLRLAEFSFNKEKQKEILESSYGGFWNYDVIDFCFIRNMYYPPPSMMSEIKNNLEPLIHNYGSSNEIVNQKMATALLCKKNYLVALNGASQAYPFLRELFWHKKALIPDPTFGEYYGVFRKFDTYEDIGGVDFERLASKVGDYDVVVLVNPNNPSGAYVSSMRIHGLANKNPRTKFIVDESFVEFSGDLSLLSVLEGQPLENVVIVKSLSKSYGFPGVRLGCIYTSDDTLVSDLKKWLPVWNFNSIAEHCLEILLKHRDAFSSSLAKTIEDRKNLHDALSKISFVEQVFSSSANFILFKVEDVVGEQLVPYLLNESNIFIKDVSSKFRSGKYFRVAVRLPSEHDVLIGGLNSLVSK